jgi:hypothetical protein
MEFLNIGVIFMKNADASARLDWSERMVSDASIKSLEPVTAESRGMCVM